MSDFMADDVCLREIARGVEAVLKLLKKRSIEINTLIAWAIKRTHGSLAEPACGIDGAGEQNEFWSPVLTSLSPKDIGPGVFGVPDHGFDELLRGVICGVTGGRGG